jgi:hypothetical protein
MAPFRGPNKCKLKIIGLSNFLNNPLVKKMCGRWFKNDPFHKIMWKPLSPKMSLKKEGVEGGAPWGLVDNHVRWLWL